MRALRRGASTLSPRERAIERVTVEWSQRIDSELPELERELHVVMFGPLDQHGVDWSAFFMPEPAH